MGVLSATTALLKNRLLTLALLACALWAQAQGTLQFGATLTGSQVVPPNSDLTLARVDFWLIDGVLHFHVDVPLVTFTAMRGAIHGAACRARKRPSFLIWAAQDSIRAVRSVTRQVIASSALSMGRSAQGHLRSHPIKSANSKQVSGPSRLLRSRCRTARFAGKSCPCQSLRHVHFSSRGAQYRCSG